MTVAATTNLSPLLFHFTRGMHTTFVCIFFSARARSLFKPIFFAKGMQLRPVSFFSVLTKTYSVFFLLISFDLFVIFDKN